MTDAGRPVGLIETMRAEAGEIPLLHLHLARLAASATTFGYPLDLAETRRQVREIDSAEARVRLVLWPDGRVDVEASDPPPAPFRTAAIYPIPMEEAGTWRCTHKTTVRAHYDRALAWAAERGIDEPILLNPRGEVMEGARTNVVIREGERLLTPPLEAGGLAGVARRVLVDEGAEERVLRPADLARADEILLVNAVRGRMPVNLVPSQA